MSNLIGHNGGPPLHEAALLPLNSTPWERAQSLTSDARRPLPADLIKALWNPATCPLPLLPYLAWALSVDVWDDRWPETKKRDVVAKSIELHRLKTTPAGIKAHVDVVGSKVLRIIRPPARTYGRAAYTEAARAAWLDRLPAVEIRPYVQPSVAKSRGFFCGPAGHTFAGWQRRTRGDALWGRRVFYVVDGVATAASLEQVQAIGAAPFDRIAIRRSGRRRSFYGRTHYGHGFLQATVADDQVLSVRLSPEAQAFAVVPNASVVDVRATRVYRRRIAPAHRAFVGRTHYGHGFLQRTFAPVLVSDRIAIHDPARSPAVRKTRSFWGFSRYGIKPYTAEVLLRVPLRRPASRRNRFWARGFAQRADMAPLWHAVDAIRVSKAARDTVMIDLATSHIVSLRDAPMLGFTLGERRAAVRGQALPDRVQVH